MPASLPRTPRQSTTGLLTSLASLLPRGHALARRARHLAHRLNQHNRPPRALALAGTEMLAALLEETDDVIGATDSTDAEVLDPAFDD